MSAAIFGVANMSDIARYFLFSPSVSQMCDFLAGEKIAERLNRRQRLRLLSILPKIKNNPERYQFAIDDTFVYHGGKNMWGVYSWFYYTKITLLCLENLSEFVFDNISELPRAYY